MHNKPKFISVTALVPVATEQRLHLVCMRMRNEFGQDYAETFAEILELGIQVLQTRRAAVVRASVEAMEKAKS